MLTNVFFYFVMYIDNIVLVLQYLDYIMKVLLPEMLIKIHMDVHGTSHTESEKIIASQPSNGL